MYIGIKKAYTTKEVAEMINRDIQTVRKYIREGRLKSLRYGKEYYITEDSVNEFVDGGRV